MSGQQLRKVAHDPGDMQVTSHCPFCGSGQVIGRSDGNIECEFCGMTYLVRVQPMFTGMPQQPAGPGFGGPSSMAPDLMDPAMVGPDGMPLEEDPAMMGAPGIGPDGEEIPPDEMELGPPGSEGSFPPPGEEEEEDGFPPEEGGEDVEDDSDAPPFAKKDDDEEKDKGKKPPPFKKKSAAVRFPNKNKDTPEYRGHYQRGWRASHGYGTSEISPLERADLRGEPGAWYDGYTDYAVGRPKWHSLTCPSGEHEAEGCSLMEHEASRRYRTMAGDSLPEEAYIRHLAAVFGGVAVLRRAS
jgi:hypothetical protein